MWINYKGIGVCASGAHCVCFGFGCLMGARASALLPRPRLIVSLRIGRDEISRFVCRCCGGGWLVVVVVVVVVAKVVRVMIERYGERERKGEREDSH